MITITYHLRPEQKNEEIDWLRMQKVFPAVRDFWDFETGNPIVQFGVIVNPEMALLIKLRHKLDLQKDYRQR